MAALNPLDGLILRILNFLDLDRRSSEVQNMVFGCWCPISHYQPSHRRSIGFINSSCLFILDNLSAMDYTYLTELPMSVPIHGIELFSIY